MNEEKQFVRWMALVAFTIFGIAKGIPAALILLVPEPLPKPAAVTTMRYEAIAEWQVERLQADLAFIEYEGLVVAGIANGDLKADCGISQWDYPHN